MTDTIQRHGEWDVRMKPHPECKYCAIIDSKAASLITENMRLRWEKDDLQRLLKREVPLVFYSYLRQRREEHDPRIGRDVAPGSKSCTHGLSLWVPCDTCNKEFDRG